MEQHAWRLVGIQLAQPAARRAHLLEGTCGQHIGQPADGWCKIGEDVEQSVQGAAQAWKDVMMMGW